MKMVALIPARAGSKRIPGKNTRLLAGKPLIAWTIQAAQESGVFTDVLVSTEDYGITQTVFESCGSCRVIKRSEEAAADDSPDYRWVLEMCIGGHLANADAFAILRPTSPFRTADTIKRAYKQFSRDEVHSLRAVQPVREHPFKMWHIHGPGYPMTPAVDRFDDGTPWHSRPTQTLPKFYLQNASLEMAWTYVVNSFGTISGKKVAPFFTHDYEGFDLNTEDDWQEAERLIEQGTVALPSLARL